ncbi:MAG: DinB family protein [Planctomycetia bacterium]|nr:DinB family protein [Planctomycetia bacterium]
MSTIAVMVDTYKFNRDRTLATLEAVEKEPDPRAALAWRLGPGRAHIGWQLMHIGVTEEIFAAERLAPHKPGAWKELWPRFRGGSKPDDDVPPAAEIRRILAESREHLLATLDEFTDAQLGDIPPALAERGWPLRVVLSVIGWHEAHHQGQAHVTYNLFKASRA